jgi:hypothetical protein
LFSIYCSEYKRLVNGNLAAVMPVDCEMNPHAPPIYGVGVTGKFWQFLVLQGKEYCVSKSFATDDEEIFEIVKILKAIERYLT